MMPAAQTSPARPRMRGEQDSHAPSRAAADARFLAPETVSQIAQQVLECTNGGGNTSVTISSWWNGEVLWARNRVSLSSDRRDIRITIVRTIDGARAGTSTNQWDSASLQASVRAAERSAWNQLKRGVSEYVVTPPLLPSPQTKIWSDQTYNLSVEQRGALARVLVDSAEPHDLLSAGYLETRAAEVAVRNTASATPDSVTYIPFTQAQCSMTVRHPKGVGSGWAGLSSFDWAALDSESLAARALEKCLASLNPVAIEPGRYTSILEPQAVFGFAMMIVRAMSAREHAEYPTGEHAFKLGIDPDLGIVRSKLGLKVVDERITMSHDPSDPLLGVLPSPGLRPITWIRDGILTTLAYSRKYALEQLHENDSANARVSFRMSGGDTPVEEMIRTTKRGVYVTRFSNLQPIHGPSILYTGVTRDGLWLVENGRISKAIKNFRFTESPLFIFNQLEQIGVPTPVFWPVEDPYEPGVHSVIVPPMKVNDFSFTAMIDAV